MKVKEAIAIVENDGWYLVRTRGSHRQYKHPIKSGLVTIAGKLSDDLASGTANSILKQAQLKGNKVGETDSESEIEAEDNSHQPIIRLMYQIYLAVLPRVQLLKKCHHKSNPQFHFISKVCSWKVY
jgi:predicted RNA binding protein YcfA (HicA-like mRNA interferase family)